MSESGAPARARSPWAQLATLLGSFAAGPLAGSSLAAWLAPGSTLAEIAGTFAFPLAWIGGMVGWVGLAIVTLLFRLVLRLAARRPRESAAAGEIPPGHGAFVVTAVGLAAIAGIVVGIVREGSFVAAAAIFTIAGLGYGLLLRSLAANGYLPFPEGEA